MIVDPLEKPVKDCFVLLYHKQPWTLLRGDCQMFCYSSIEITIIGPVCRTVWIYVRISTMLTNTNITGHAIPVGRFIPQEPFFQPYLGL